MKGCCYFLLLFSIAANGQVSETSFLARSATSLTMLGYGLGQDRLGGAKAGYIDSNILLSVIDTVKGFYKVQLSKNRTAFVSKSELKRDTITKPAPFYLVNSWSVKGDQAFDYVNISLDERMPYKSWMEVNPAKIFVEIYGVQSNTNWITQLRSVKEIKDVYFNQVEDDVMRVTIELKHNNHWGYTVGYHNNMLFVRVRRQMPELEISKMTIAIDAGHGGSNTGAIGVNNKGAEKNYTLRFANELKSILEKKGANVIMTRESDTNILNHDRVLMLQNYLPDLLISIHLNSSSNPEVKGVSTYYKHIGFRPVTTAILNRLLELKLVEFGNVGHFNFALSAPTDFPGSLVEVAFLSNADDEKKIMDPRFQRDVAKKIYLGIKDWLKAIR